MADKQDQSVDGEHPDTIEELVTTNPEDEAATAEPEKGTAPADDGGDAEGLQAQLDSAQEKLVGAQEDALRAAAEMQNVRKRAERDVENAHRYGQEKLISSLLPVLDNLDRAIEAGAKTEAGGEAVDGGESDTLKAIIEGLELTRKSAFDVLKQFSVDVLEPYGEPFDPQMHEAITMVPSETVEPNSVIDVLQKGYSLNGRLVRAAMVVVAKS